MPNLLLFYLARVPRGPGTASQGSGLDRTGAAAYGRPP